VQNRVTSSVYAVAAQAAKRPSPAFEYGTLARCLTSKINFAMIVSKLGQGTAQRSCLPEGKTMRRANKIRRLNASVTSCTARRTSSHTHLATPSPLSQKGGLA